MISLIAIGTTFSSLLILARRYALSPRSGIDAVPKRALPLLILIVIIGLVFIPEKLADGCSGALPSQVSVEASFFLILTEVAYTIFGLKSETTLSLTTSIHIAVALSETLAERPCDAGQFAVSIGVAILCVYERFVWRHRRPHKVEDAAGHEEAFELQHSRRSDQRLPPQAPLTKETTLLRF